jgi:predicted Zn-dependent peptidase
MKELRSMNGGATEDEVARARNYVARSYPSEFQTIGAISESIQQAVVHNQPDTYFSSYIERIGAVTKAGVEQAATKYVDPDNAVVVIVGDRKEIESKVAALGLGTIDLVSVDDILGEHH